MAKICSQLRTFLHDYLWRPIVKVLDRPLIRSLIRHLVVSELRHRLLEAH